MARKAPRRTAERILETALELFNQFGEPNVSTTLLAAELRISPGNLYYHYPAKEEIVNRLAENWQAELDALLPASAEVSDVEDAWFFMHSLFELLWRHRFIYRDLNELLSRNRQLELRCQRALADKTQAVHWMLAGMSRAGNLQIEARSVEAVSQSMVVMLTYWLSFEYVRNPRQALEPGHAQHALLRGAHHTLHMLAPYLAVDQRQHLLTLGDAYAGDGSAVE